MKGEACFDVASDLERPFYVHAGNAKVRVVGTRFNVRAWEVNPTVTVTVAEGTVAVTAEDTMRSNKATLTRGQQCLLYPNGTLSDPIFVNAEKHFNWMKNEIYLNNVKTREVVDQLRRWYDYDIEFQNSQKLGKVISIHMYATNIDEVFQVISMVTKTTVITEGKKVIFKEK